MTLSTKLFNITKYVALTSSELSQHVQLRKIVDVKFQQELLWVVITLYLDREYQNAKC